MMTKKLSVLLSVLVISFSGIGFCETRGSDTSTLISTARVNSNIKYCGEKVPVKIDDVRERFEKEMLLAVDNRSQVILWIKRAGRFLPIIEKMLKDNNMPQDLKYIPFIESAMRPHAGSSKGAVGFWQFIAETGRRYGLLIDPQEDERRSIFHSTEAAIKYLKDLHNEFGSWTLATAAYNMGEERLRSEIKEQKTNDYYKLYLSLETQRYLFKIIAAKMTISNPAKYGFILKKKDIYKPMQFEKIIIKTGESVPIQLIAEAADTHFKIIKDMNPEIRGYYIAKGKKEILIPKGGKAQFWDRYDALRNSWKADNKRIIHEVQKGEHLTMIAQKYKVPLAAILIWNHIDYRKPIYPGDTIIVFPFKKMEH